MIIPHIIISKQKIISIQVYGFAMDVSISEYGSSLYLRSTDTLSVHNVHLYERSLKVAPLKVIYLLKC